MTVSQLKRARSTEAKEERRAAILAAAHDLFDSRSYEDITMADVARKSRLAKGTVFLYFPTREALFLSLLEELLAEWLAVLHDAVASDEKPWPSARLSRVMTDSLFERPSLLRLLPLQAGILENGVTATRSGEFRRSQLKRFFSIGSLIEQRLNLAHAGDGVNVLMFAKAMIVGVTGHEDLRTALTVLFNGFHRKS